MAPNDKQRITPYFTVKNADAFVSFVRDVFKADLFKEDRYPDGAIRHARLSISGNVIMLNEASDEYQPNQSQLHVYVDSVEQTYSIAPQQGATSLTKPNLRPHGDRMAGFKDPFGNIWWIAAEAG